MESIDLVFLENVSVDTQTVPLLVLFYKQVLTSKLERTHKQDPCEFRILIKMRHYANITILVQLYYSLICRLRVVPSFPSGDRREPGVEKDKISGG